MNKLGVNNSKLRKIEKEVIKTKINLLDEYYTFNKQEYDLDYLISLHEYLFLDFYAKEDLKTRELSEDEKVLINLYFKKITCLCVMYTNENKQILDLIKEIWILQPFYIGNTRTLFSFLKILNEAFSLGLNINSNIEIKSNYKFFDLDNFVNQKRLTK